MATHQQEATAEGFDRKWAMFFLVVLALVVGAFVVQRFVFAPARIETQGQPAALEQAPSP